METFLSHSLGTVCGQNPAHTWTVCGTALPVCQRCTGLYLGALAALLLLLVCRPVLRPHFAGWHAVSLLFLGISGIGWLPANEWLRAGSGVLGGAAIATFLWVWPSMTWLKPPRHRSPRSAESVYWLGLLSVLGILPVAARATHAFVGTVLAMLTGMGLAMLLALALANLWLLARDLRRRVAGAVGR